MGFPEVTTHAILLDKNQTQILLVKGINPLGEKVWGFPGGHIEIGEKVEDALIREVEEETGCNIKVDCLLGVYDNLVKDSSSKRLIAHIINIIWIAETASDKIVPHEDKEIIKAQWFPFSRAKRLKMSPNARKILDDALSKIAKDKEVKRSPRAMTALFITASLITTL